MRVELPALRSGDAARRLELSTNGLKEQNLETASHFFGLYFQKGKDLTPLGFSESPIFLG